MLPRGPRRRRLELPDADRRGYPDRNAESVRSNERGRLGGPKTEAPCAGAELLVAGESRVDLPAAFSALERHGISRILVEGGGELIFSLFESGLIDELSVYVGNLVIGGRDAPTLADGEGFLEEFPELELDSVERIDSGVVLSWTVTPHGE